MRDVSKTRITKVTVKKTPKDTGLQVHDTYNHMDGVGRSRYRCGEFENKTYATHTIDGRDWQDSDFQEQRAAFATGVREGSWKPAPR
jgi:hypothetical protein